MKKLLYLGAARKLMSVAGSTKRFKVLIVAGIVFLLFLGGLAVWGGVQATRYAFSLSESPSVIGRIQDLTSKAQELLVSNGARCLESAQGLLQVNLWTERAWQENINVLKTACLGPGEPQGMPLKGETI